MSQVLSPETIQQTTESFNQNGSCVIPGFLSSQEVATLRAEAAKLLSDLDVDSHPMTVFSTGTNQKEHVGDKYFFESWNKVHYFFEEGAIDASGKLIVEKEKAVNKIGHGLHELSAPFKELSHSPKVKQIANAFNFKDPRILQSMLIFKQPEIGGVVPPHQDSTFLYTEPLSAFGFWFALEDCTMGNGCLEYIPKSHNVPVKKRFVRKPQDKGTEFVDLPNVDTSAWDDIDDSQYQALEVKAGSLVLINGSVLHRSSPNLSKSSRWVYAFHCIEGNNSYDKRNWLQPDEGCELTKLFKE
ncbi:hypothetical protein BB561_001164 [Smittium simulii]|uniref:Fe2OG dioxygenase domain-containing protein n=1 Tax=Smittium simulii TaxID=133385 RepID=A0A2T9YVW8_9FUNG|nr:hypothetical protein BB561_001164 [Smittium simulii]